MGQAFEPLAPGRNPQDNPNLRCLADETIESEAPGRVPQENPLLRPGQPGSIISPCSSQCADSSQVLQVSQPLTFASSTNQPSSHSLSLQTEPQEINNSLNLANSRVPFFLAAFNVRTLCQAGQRASLAQTLLSLNIDVCCVSETRIQDPSSIIRLEPPRTDRRFSSFTLRVSGDASSSARGIYGVGIALSPRAERSLLEWIPVNSRLCAMRLRVSIKVNANRSRNRCLFVVSAYAPTDTSPENEKDDFYRDLSQLLRSAKSSDIVVLAGDMNAQIGRLNSMEAHLGGRFSVDMPRSDNGERLLHLCTDHRLFLANTNFQHKRLHRLTWRPPNPSQPWKQLDHIAISYRWRASIQDCRSFWSTPLDSDHAIVRATFSIKFPVGRRKSCHLDRPQQLQSAVVAEQYELKLTQNLEVLNHNPARGNVEEDWNHIKEAMLSASKAVCPLNPGHAKEHWISTESANLIESRKTIPASNDYDAARKSLRRRIKNSLRRDRERWWLSKARAMEKAFASGDSRTLFQLIRSTGPKVAGVSETIREKDGTTIHSLNRRLERWAEHFTEQFNQPSPTACALSGQEPTWNVNLCPPSEQEVRCEIQRLKSNKSPGPDELHPLFFKQGGERLVACFTKLLQSVWNDEVIPNDWSASTVVPIFKKGARTQCENHRGISLISVASKVLASIILRRLLAHREKQTRENQCGFRPGRGCIDHIFTLRQLLESRHSFGQPTIIVFLDLKAAFDSVDRQALWQCLLTKGIPSKYLNILKALYHDSRGRVKVYGKLSPEFTTSSGVRQGCPLSPFLFNFVIDMILELSLSSSNDCGVELLPGGRLTDIEYADDIALLGTDPSKMQLLLSNLGDVSAQFGLHFAPSKCKVLLQDWSGLQPSLMVSGEPLAVVDKFTYLGSCISSNANVVDEITAQITKARQVFGKLQHLWRQRTISLRVKGRIYQAAVRSVLLYGSETWPVRSEDIRRLATFDHRCLRNIAGVWWEHRMNNSKVRHMVLGAQARSISELMTLHRLRWLGHVLRMPEDRLPRRALFSQPHSSWKRPRGGQSMTWQRSMKTLTSKLSRVGACRLPGWGPRDGSVKWLETLADMAQNRHQWRSCIHTISLEA